MLVRKIMRLINAILIFPLVTYQLLLFYTLDSIDFEHEILINKIEIAYYLADAFWLFVILKNRDKDMIYHHIVTITIISCAVYYRTCMLESAFEYFAVEQSAFFSMLRDILKSFRQQNTKTVIIIELLYLINFMLTKITMRLVLIFYYVFKWNSSKLIRSINFLIQILYFLWGYNLVKGAYAKWTKGYFSLSNFEQCPWISRMNKDD